MIDDRINKKRMKLIGALFDKLCFFGMKLSATSSHVVDVGVVVVSCFCSCWSFTNYMYVRKYKICHLKLFVGYVSDFKKINHKV